LRVVLMIFSNSSSISAGSKN